jgi:hypothetical protein
METLNKIQSTEFLSKQVSHRWCLVLVLVTSCEESISKMIHFPTATDVTEHGPRRHYASVTIRRATSNLSS